MAEESGKLQLFVPSTSAALVRRSLGWLAAKSAYENGLRMEAEARWEEAAQSYREAVRESPFFPQAWFHLGLSVRWLKDKEIFDIFEFHPRVGFKGWKGPCIEESVASFRTAIAQQPNFPEAQLELGLTGCGKMAARRGFLPFGTDSEPP